MRQKNEASNLMRISAVHFQGDGRSEQHYETRRDQDKFHDKTDTDWNHE